MRSSIFLKIVNIAKSALPTVLFPVSLFPAIIVMPLNARLACPTFARLSMMSRIIAFSLLNRRRYSTTCFDTMGADTMVKKLFSHYAPSPLQQPQMPDMKQVKRSVCNHIRHFSLLSHLPSAGNPSTQPPIRRLALPLFRSITQPNAHASLYRPTPQSASFHQPRHTLQTHSSPPPPTPTGNSFTLYRPSTNSCNINSHHVNTYFLVAATTVFLTFSQVKLLSNISGIGSSSASSKYINPRRGKESSETENFSLYKESI